MPAPESIRKLVETFEQNISDYRSHKNETELRRQFLDKFFTALGWDVDNLQGAREAEKEVAHEFSVEIEGQQKKADYAFRIKRDSAIVEKFDFLVEAKKPSVKIESSLDAAFQIRRYGWSAKLPINILTDFEHFAVYDCRVKPKYGEKAVLNRQMLFHYKEYIEKWDEIVSLFSPEAIRAGSLSEYVKSIKGKRGTADVDDDFLQEIERWRELLAKNIAARNEWIDISALNYAVQMIIDRIIFLRICEERSIEPENQLQDITNKENIYKELCWLFKRADTKYNSGLFHFAKESGEASRADDLTLRLDIDNKTLKDIILNLYYPKSPYAFLYIPSDILGQVYERFLGKVIKLTDGHRAKVEEKPEVRKAGGVFYTPTFIVTYIVINTLGKLLFGLTPKEAAKLKIVDPACGSGTFLLGAFEYLLVWHLKWYSENDPEKWIKNKAVIKVGNDYRLTTAKKKEILLNNIYGVDIDAQAVEVTKLSLLLKVLENASGQMELGMERILPDLGNNIKCGNSLVDEDYFEGELMVDDEERARVNPFDWKAAFPEVFAQGGFDVVIGNPPYVDIIGIPLDQRKYFQKTYDTFLYRSDILSVFFHKVIDLLRENGRIGFITSNTYFSSSSANKLRSLMAKSLHIEEIIDLGGGVFSQANVDTAIFLGNKRNPQSSDIVYIAVCKKPDDFKYIVSKNAEFSYTLPQSQFALLDGSSWTISSGAIIDKLVTKIGSLPIRLDSCVEFSRGYIAYDAHRGHSQQMIENRIFHSPTQLTPKYKKELLGSDIGRYSLGIKSDLWIQFGKNLAAPRDERFHAGQRIWIQRIRNPKLPQRLVCFYTDKNEDLAASSGLTIARKIGGEWDLRAICGLLNSHLINWWFRQLFHDVNIKPADMVRIPLPNINFSNSAEKAQHDKIVAFVESMLGLHKSLASAQSPLEKERLERQIKSTDGGIDKLVYELYGLTDDEINIVEDKK